MRAPPRRGSPTRLPLLAAIALAQVLPPEPPLAAQTVSSALPGAWPEGWVVRADRAAADPDDVAFTDMPPGWHVTTGPAVILYRAADSVGGRFRVEMEVYLFDPGTRRESFGFFTGGHRLDGDAPGYTWFLIREGGEYIVERRRGAVREAVTAWTPHPAIRSFGEVEEGEATARNVLILEAGDERVRLLVNGEELVALPREGLDLDGIVGLRVSGALNLHVSRLDVTAGG